MMTELMVRKGGSVLDPEDSSDMSKTWGKKSLFLKNILTAKEAVNVSPLELVRASPAILPGQSQEATVYLPKALQHTR